MTSYRLVLLLLYAPPPSHSLPLISIVRLANFSSPTTQNPVSIPPHSSSTSGTPPPQVLLLFRLCLCTLLIPFAFLDVCICLYQWICFRAWNVPRVRRENYIIIDRHRLAYLNGIQKPEYNDHPSRFIYVRPDGQPDDTKHMAASSQLDIPQPSVASTRPPPKGFFGP